VGRPTNHQKHLRDFMSRHSLTRPDVARALCVNVSTVDRWLVPTGSKSYRKMPDMARKLLVYIETYNHEGEFLKKKA
jgi:DNA-binding transcriptional regulator YiaG